MRTTTNETRAYSAKSRPASTTNVRKHIQTAAQSASGLRRRRFGMSVGEAIVIALAFNAAARPVGGEQ